MLSSCQLRLRQSLLLQLHRIGQTLLLMLDHGKRSKNSSPDGCSVRLATYTNVHETNKEHHNTTTPESAAAEVPVSPEGAAGRPSDIHKHHTIRMTHHPHSPNLTATLRNRRHERVSGHNPDTRPRSVCQVCHVITHKTSRGHRDYHYH